MAFKRGGAIFHFNVTDLACVKILKVKISYFRVNLETFCARKVGEYDSEFYQSLSRLQQRRNCVKMTKFCAFGAKYKNKISHDLNTVDGCYLTMMLEIDYIFHKMRKNDILTTFRSLQRAHNTKSPRGLCNGFTSGIKPSEFCTVLVCRG